MGLLVRSMESSRTPDILMREITASGYFLTWTDEVEDHYLTSVF